MPLFIHKNLDHLREDQDIYVFMNNTVQEENKKVLPQKIFNLAVQEAHL